MLFLRPFAPLFTMAATRYIEQNARRYRALSRTLTIREHEALGRFFASDLLHCARVANAAVPVPPRIHKIAIAFQMDALLQPELTAAITLDNVIVHAEPISMRVLFHELVHVEQYKQLKIAGFARLYVRSFLRTGKYDEIPLEQHAYELDEQYAANPAFAFSVRNEVRRWIESKRY
jgi:hypothetical protein